MKVQTRMGPAIPASIPQPAYESDLLAGGFELLHRGKVRNIYRCPSSLERLLLFVASDRISIFDFVLPATVPRKGEVLTALTWFWLAEHLSGFGSHLFLDTEAGRNSNPISFLRHKFPAIPPERSLLVRKFQVQPYELIFRRHLGGSVWQEYLKSGTVASQPMPAGLRKWEKLDRAVFTPSTKSATGHDINISVAQYAAEVGIDVARRSQEMLRRAYDMAYDYALERGVVILDTKFEADMAGRLVLDEVLTPDSSRFTTVHSVDEAVATGKDPVFYDKEPVREWGSAIKRQNLQTDDPNALDFVAGLKVPTEIVEATTHRYLEIFSRLTGKTLEEFQRENMGL